MVTMCEVNRDALRDMFDNDLLKAYRFALIYGEARLAIPSKQVNKLLIFLLKKAEFTPKQITSMTGASPYMAKKNTYHFSKGFINAVFAINNLSKIIEKSDDYAAVQIPINKAIVERLIIEDLVLAEWSAEQIVAATGFSRGRILRKQKELI